MGDGVVCLENTMAGNEQLRQERQKPECGRPCMPGFGDREQQKGFRQRSSQVRLEFYEDYSGYKVGIDRRE